MQSKLFIIVCLIAISQPHIISINDILKNSLATRIIGGREAIRGEFPHQVSLQLEIKHLQPFVHFCGGSILSETYILTAGHCLDALEKIKLQFEPLGYKVTFAVKAGKHDLSKSEDTEQASLVESYVKHPKWQGDGQPGPNDVAVLKLKTPLRLNKRVAKIRLPMKDSEPSGNAILSGWGASSNDTENPIMPRKLKTLDTPIISRDICDKAVEAVAAEEGEILENSIDVTNICTGPMKGGTSACGGDSGGPLILKGTDGQYEVIGIVSWGMIPCGRKGAPTVYVKVSSFTSWIVGTAMKI